MEIESESVIPFMDVLVIRKGTTLTTGVYRKPTHTGRYFNFKSDHPPLVKIGLVQSRHNTASVICQIGQDLFNWIDNLKRDFQLNGYPKPFIDSVINSKGSSHPEKEGEPLGSVYTPYVKDVSRKFRRTGNRYNIRTIFQYIHIYIISKNILNELCILSCSIFYGLYNFLVRWTGLDSIYRVRHNDLPVLKRK
jgi:hypothetical protein